ncbi:glycoside hydrolase family 57 protein [Cystobacter ferrugineus]|uniref:Glycoside hydrolase n=1 Tax=Cystobacter ferrugineus TaxID=83449 RepID=A0A1L9B784_9BACT|nr:1,4-alpha-glucan branching protein domain-containing protein [Cystobacter ferrugineus]OJH38112.1 glycoside hydrolase [Cystobacter ferrugineus]
MSIGSLAIILHAHLPFVRHPEYENFLEEDWLYEAISETYLPLLLVFDRLAEEDVPFRLTLTLTPTLVTMLRDELLMSRYAQRLERLCELGAREVHRTRNDPVFGRLARFHRDHFESLRQAFHERYKRDLVGAFRRLQDAGHLEIITCNATHGFLPLMQQTPEAVRAQISVAASHYRLTFGRDAPGIWLAECGYFPGVEKFLAAERIRYFFVDTHGLTDATPRPLNGPFAPIYTEAGVAAYARDPESSQQVWSAERGYPGDPHYREFYRDIGWDLELDYVRPYIQPTGDRKNTGFKYYRITGKAQDKQPYDPDLARERADVHAGNFLFNREKQFEWLAGKVSGRKPVVVAPYDAELFGHWWFEGPWFLDALLRKVAREQKTFSLVTPSDDLAAHPENQVATPPLSSWGAGGYATMWLDGANDWIYRHLHHCARQMIALAKDFPDDSPTLQRRALNQAARELLLAQSSDWAFIMKTGTMVDYAVRRTKEHVLRFLRLHEQLRAGRIDEEQLTRFESTSTVFPEIDYRVYRPE